MAATRALATVKRLPPRAARESFLSFDIDQVWVDRAVADHPQTLLILNRLKGISIDVVDDVGALRRTRDLSEAKRQLILTAHRGEAFKPCQGITPHALCCNYRVLDLASGCPMDCSYCILQSYLANNPVTTVYVNLEEILARLASFLAAHPNRCYRIGTGELADSLALDRLTDVASILIPFFAARKNAILELKTKTAAVDHLLRLAHGDRTVLAWSVNTPEIIASEERGTAPLDERLAAAQRAAAAGYGIGFHFDPIVLTRGALDIEPYLAVADRIFEAVAPHQIAWVSLGLLRYPPELADIATRRFPRTTIFTGELIPAGNKMRYLRFIRESAAQRLWEHLAAKLPLHKLYLCMETTAVWEKVDPSIATNACIEKRLCSIGHDAHASET